MSGLVNPTPALQVFNSMTLAPYLKIIYFSATPSAGLLTVHPTSDGTATGTAVFSDPRGLLAEGRCLQHLLCRTKHLI